MTRPPTIGFLTILVLSCCVLACTMARSIDRGTSSAIGDYHYTSYDEKGKKVVEGRISITSSERRRIGSEETTQLKGNWELKKVGDQKTIGAQEGVGELIGSDSNGEIYLDLNPNISDANVILRGKIEGRRFHGTWSFNGYAGPIIKGTFEATKK